jgi:hypothetical protein
MRVSLAITSQTSVFASGRLREGVAMSWLESKMKWIMLVGGLFTIATLYAFVAPSAALVSLFGESIEGPVANVVVRNWGFLIATVGALLIYGAFRPAARPLTLTVAVVTKVVFIGLVLAGPRSFLHHQIGLGVVVDSALVLIFAIYLWSASRRRSIA